MVNPRPQLAFEAQGCHQKLRILQFITFVVCWQRTRKVLSYLPLHWLISVVCFRQRNALAMYFVVPSRWPTSLCATAPPKKWVGSLGALGSLLLIFQREVGMWSKGWRLVQWVWSELGCDLIWYCAPMTCFYSKEKSLVWVFHICSFCFPLLWRTKALSNLFCKVSE